MEATASLALGLSSLAEQAGRHEGCHARSARELQDLRRPLERERVEEEVAGRLAATAPGQPAEHATRPPGDDADGSVADGCQHHHRCQQRLRAGTAMASGARPPRDDADALFAAKRLYLQCYHQGLRERSAWRRHDKASSGDLNLLVYGILFGMVSGMMVMIFVLELLPTAYHVRGATSKIAIGLKNSPFGLGLVIAAGTSTALGAGALFQGRISSIAGEPVLAAGFGYSGGVLLHFCFIEFFFKAQIAFAADRSEGDTYQCATLALSAGVAVVWLITGLVHMINRNHVAVQWNGGPPLETRTCYHEPRAWGQE